jgi:hypothetical protein
MYRFRPYSSDAVHKRCNAGSTPINAVESYDVTNDTDSLLFEGGRLVKTIASFPTLKGFLLLSSLLALMLIVVCNIPWSIFEVFFFVPTTKLRIALWLIAMSFCS